MKGGLRHSFSVRPAEHMHLQSHAAWHYRVRGLLEESLRVAESSIGPLPVDIHGMVTRGSLVRAGRSNRDRRLLRGLQRRQMGDLPLIPSDLGSP